MGPPETGQLIRQLSCHHRVLMLGGLAVISHGHTRSTIDADIWLDSMLPIENWCAALQEIVAHDPKLEILSLGTWQTIGPAELAGVIVEERVIRIIGGSQPLDVFREPNELGVEEFDDVWSRAQPMDDGTRVPDPIDLLATKLETGRDQDWLDINFLEKKAENIYLEKLPHAATDEILGMLERFLTPRVAEAAAGHPDPEVRHLGIVYLRELADAGDPFAVEILRKLGEDLAR